MLHEFSTSDHFQLVISLFCLSLPLFDDTVNPHGHKVSQIDV